MDRWSEVSKVSEGEEEDKLLKGLGSEGALPKGKVEGRLRVSMLSMRQVEFIDAGEHIAYEGVIRLRALSTASKTSSLRKASATRLGSISCPSLASLNESRRRPRDSEGLSRSSPTLRGAKSFGNEDTARKMSGGARG